MKNIVIRSSKLDLVAIFLIALFFLLFINFRFGFSIKSLIVVAILFLFIVVSQLKKYSEFVLNGDYITINKPFEFTSRTKQLRINDIIKVELIGFKGPTFNFHCKNGLVLHIHLISFEKRGVIMFSNFLKSHNITTTNF